jgi:PAS domain S-box-containing protein
MSQAGEPSDLQAGLLEQFTHTGNGVMGVDVHHRIILWNPAAEELLGYAAQEVLGKPCYNVMMACGGDCELACSEHCSQFKQARQLQWSSEQMLEGKTKAGKKIRLHVISFCLLSSKQKLSALIHVFWRANGTLRPSDSRDFLPLGALQEPPLASLSSQQLTILRCMTAGMDTKSTAALLFISPTTVRNHVQHILRKLGVHSRLEAVELAHRHHLRVPLPDPHRPH